MNVVWLVYSHNRGLMSWSFLFFKACGVIFSATSLHTSRTETRWTINHKQTTAWASLNLIYMFYKILQPDTHMTCVWKYTWTLLAPPPQHTLTVAPTYPQRSIKNVHRCRVPRVRDTKNTAKKQTISESGTWTSAWHPRSSKTEAASSGATEACLLERQ